MSSPDLHRPAAAAPSPTGDVVAELKAAVAERETALLSERLAREEAERLGHLKDEFLATLSHELRAPLNAILGWSAMMRRSPPTGDELVQGLQTIERNARQQAAIISDLLDMSRLVSGRMHLDVRSLEMPEVIEAAIDAVRPAAQAKQVRVQSTLDARVGRVRGDLARLQQVFWNLLSNAVKFTPRCGRVHVSLQRVDSQVEITIDDTGCGIAPEFLPHVFDRFRQADGSTTRTNGGLGLGLSIARSLVEMHGGTLVARSGGIGRGASFVVSLPMSVVRIEDTGMHRRLATLPEESAVVLPSLDGIHVLVVDDEEDARGVTRRILQEQGALVDTVGSANEAFEQLRSGRHHVIVSDVGMPGIDGYAFLRQLRALPRERGGALPAIALTAYARGEDRQRALLSGFQQHIAKPLEPAELVAGVAALIGLARASRDGARTPQ